MNPEASETRLVTGPSLRGLARLLRLLGYDVTVTPDEASADATTGSSRWLTRDPRGARPEDLVLTGEARFHQAREVARALGPPPPDAPVRCPEDNRSVPLGAAPPRCPGCGRPVAAGAAIAALRSVLSAQARDPVGPSHPPDADAPPAPVLEPLLDLHNVMEVALTRHRLALMRAEPEAAEDAFRRFAAAMRAHIAEENAEVLPRYAARPPPQGYPRGADPSIFTREHEKIEGHLARLEAATAALARSGLTGDALRVRCLHLLDREKTFVDLLAHHDDRERAHLYPTVEVTLEPADRLRLLDRLVPGTCAPLLP